MVKQCTQKVIVQYFLMIYLYQIVLYICYRDNITTENNMTTEVTTKVTGSGRNGPNINIILKINNQPRLRISIDKIFSRSQK